MSDLGMENLKAISDMQTRLAVLETKQEFCDMSQQKQEGVNKTILESLGKIDKKVLVITIAVATIGAVVNYYPKIVALIGV